MGKQNSMLASDPIRTLRLKSWQMIHEVAAFVVSERLRQMHGVLAKYSANQPRVPAGNPAGGQWTDGSGGARNPLPGTVFMPQQPNNGGYVIEESPIYRRPGAIIFDGAPEGGNGRNNPGTPPFIPTQKPQAPTPFEPGVALGNLLGQGIGRVVNALGDVFGSFGAMVKNAFSGFATQFEVPYGVDANGAKVIPEQVNIFIGGADDSDGNFGNHPVRDSIAMSNGVHGYNIYATYDQGKEISAAIQKLPPNVQVNIVGHSYGGDTATRVALEKPGRVSVLVTVDPVATFGSSLNFGDVRSSVGAWVNVNATGKPGSGFLGLSSLAGDNIVAGVGGVWSENVKPFVDMYVEAPYNHADFGAMMRYDIGGKTTIESILNRRR